MNGRQLNLEEISQKLFELIHDTCKGAWKIFLHSDDKVWTSRNFWEPY